MSGVEDEHSVEEFSMEAADPEFHDRVCVGHLDWSLDGLDALTGEDRVDHAGECGVSVGPKRCGAGSIPARVRIVQTVEAPAWRSMPASSPAMRRYPRQDSRWRGAELPCAVMVTWAGARIAGARWSLVV